MPAFKLTSTVEQLQEHMQTRLYNGDPNELAFDMMLDPQVLRALFLGALIYVEEDIEDPKAKLQRVVKRWATLTNQDREAFISSLNEDLLSPPVSGDDLKAISRMIPVDIFLRGMSSDVRH